MLEIKEDDKKEEQEKKVEGVDQEKGPEQVKGPAQEKENGLDQEKGPEKENGNGNQIPEDKKELAKTQTQEEGNFVCELFGIDNSLYILLYPIFQKCVCLIILSPKILAKPTKFVKKDILGAILVKTLKQDQFFLRIAFTLILIIFFYKFFSCCMSS